MDYSSLTDSQQLYQQYQQYQQQQQPQPYDPSQPQSYDPSSAYYQYYQQQQQQYQYQPYYQQQPDYYQQQQNESTPIQPPGVSAPEVHRQNPVVPSSGLNPAAAAAVAALSQLTQFAGSMDAAERAMAGMHDRQWPMPMPMPMHPYMQAAPPPPPPPQYGHGYGGYHHGPYPGHRGGRAPHRGGGRRGGGGPFRGGGGRGNSGHHPPRTDGSSSQFRGRGRGRGGNRGGKQHGVSSHPETLPTGELPSEQVDVGTSTVMQGGTQSTATVPPAGTASRKVGLPGRAPSTRKQPQIAWCELCRVDCTSLDILEQHKNGKKHKKNLQRFEELQKAGNPMAMTLHSVPAPAPAPIPALASTPMLGTGNTTNSTAPDPTPTSDPSLSLSLPSESTTPKPDVQNQQESMTEPKSDELAPTENVEVGVTNNSEAPENVSTEANDDASKVEPEQQNDNVGNPEGKDGEPSEAPGKKRRLERFDNRKRGMNKKMRGGRGAKRMRTFDRPTRLAEPPKPKEVVPILCDLCNVKCDTAAVFETHLAGKKHMSKLKRFQGHQARFGALGVQALYPPNPNTQPIFIPQVHNQTMYPPQGHFHQPVAYVPHAQGATFSEPQTAQNHGAHVTWDGSQNDMPLEFKAPEGAIDIHSENNVKVSENVSLPTTSQNTTFSGLNTKMDDAAVTNEVPA